MLDRIELIQGLNRLPLKMTATAHRAFEKTLDKAVGQMLFGLPLPAARAAPGSVRKAIAEALNESLVMADLKKVSKLWEPKRTVPAGVAHRDLAADLTDLMEGRREPFEPTKLSLNQAQALSSTAKAELVLGIQRFATLPQVKATLKKWDKASPALTGGDDVAVRDAALRLLRGT